MTFPAMSQNEPVGMGMMTPGVVAKPTFEKVENGINFKVWIMSVVNDASSQLDTNEVNLNKATDATTDESKPATHHVMVELKDATEGKELSDATVRLELLSPTGKTDIIDLETMMNQYGGNIPLPETGEYKLNLNVTTEDGRTVKTPFSYKVSR